MPTPAKYFGTNRKFVNRTRFDPKLILAHELFHALQLSNNETDVPFPSLLKPILGNDSFFDKEIDIEAAAIRFTNNIRLYDGVGYIRSSFYADSRIDAYQEALSRTTGK